MSEIEARRQRAHEAAWDKARLDDHTEIPDVDVAVEVATRVKLTPKIIESAGAADVDIDGPELIARLVLEAAGFEVVE
jgi:hypothetical protein